MDEEGMILVELDEVLDPRTAGENARKPGSKYHFLSVKKPGQGTAELFVSEDIYNKVKQLAAAGVQHLYLVYKLSKWQGKFEPRLWDVVEAA